MINKAFDTINAKLTKALEPKGFKKQAVSSAEGNKILSLYISDAIAYSVMYDPEKKVMLLNSCTVSDGEPDNDWKAISTWMFDPETDGIKQAEDIARDFIETFDTDKKVVLKQKRKRVKGEDGNGDPIFFFKRLVVLFPELKDEIKYEELNYVPFRAVTFAREHVVERINSMIASKDKTQMRKLAEILANQYSYGDLDVRSVITIVILNSIPNDYIEMFNSYLNDDMQKAWKNALKFKNKKVKPEKEKKVRSFISDTLNNSQ